jgi:hypothetical protein
MLFSSYELKTIHLNDRRMIINKTIYIDREKVIESVNRLVDMASKSATTKELFIVASETEWLRLYWNPVSRDWIVTLFPESTAGRRESLTSEKVKEVLEALSSKHPNIRGFQYKSSPTTLDVFRSR